MWRVGSKRSKKVSLLGLEARRSLTLWFFPIFAVLTGYAVLGELPTGVWLWPHTSVALQNSLVLVGPFAAGLSVWVAARNRRQSIDELLITTSLSTTVRELMTWAGAAIWICLGYILATAILLFITLMEATWGAPALGPIFAGLFALCMHSAVGYVIGFLLPRLFTAFLVAILDYVIQGILGYFFIVYLSPVATPVPDAFYGVFPNISAMQSLWFLGVSVLALGTVALVSREISTAPLIGVIAALALVTGVATLLLRVDPSMSPESAGVRLPDYELVCEDPTITVCVHPAYESLLPEVSTTMAKMTEPLVGIQNGPIRATQKPSQPTDFLDDGTIEFYLYDKQFLDTQLKMELVYALVQGESSREEVGELTEVQSVIAASLLQPVSDESPSNLFPSFADDNTREAFDRYSRLPQKEKRAWLKQNYTKMRAGELDPKDIP